jgi:hypothetical protein
MKTIFKTRQTIESSPFGASKAGVSTSKLRALEDRRICSQELRFDGNNQRQRLPIEPNPKSKIPNPKSQNAKFKSLVV